ncbi:hypothetical protein CVT26_005559 [Gymnopilus dilepis]|uniref:Multiple myeloma tumor-associated protein 2-like N-terminal domain-containing protein n=1 Tax=Gymnopilus dilepis TaxID=231916 RepID=A0A409XZQ0_9AGAR|nr:hypothetical protein CVT26_005559 [Gymnopilus dilepis]
MFEPVRGGTRGGQAEFKWSDVAADKDRENYLGHSINAPTGRWQKNKDIHWYNREKNQTAEERAAEIKKIKDLEAEALAAALGFGPATKTGGQTTGANSIPVASTSSNGETRSDSGKDEEKEEKRRKREERKAEKRARKELKKMSKTGAHGVHELAEKSERPRRHPSRSRSPRFRSKERRVGEERRPRSRSRSRTPRSDRRGATTRDDKESGYGSEERERARERDRRRWDANARREMPQSRRY